MGNQVEGSAGKGERSKHDLPIDLMLRDADIALAKREKNIKIHGNVGTADLALASILAGHVRSLVRALESSADGQATQQTRSSPHDVRVDAPGTPSSNPDGTPYIGYPGEPGSDPCPPVSGRIPRGLPRFGYGATSDSDLDAD